MTYQYSDAPADRDSVINTIVAFAVSNAGFTNHGDDGALRRLSKSGEYFCFLPRSAFSLGSYYQIAARMTDSLPTEETYLTTTGQTLISGFDMYQYTGPYTGLHLFTNGTEVNCVLEIAPNVFSHLSFGTPRKFGSWPGGGFITGSIYSSYTTSYYPSNYSTNPFDGGIGTTSGDRISLYYRNCIKYNGLYYGEIRQTDGRSVFWGGCSSSYNTPLYNQSQAAYNFRTPLLPMYAVIKQTGSIDRVVAVSEQARFLNLEGLVNKEVIESDWMVFPYAQRTTVISLGNSGNFGLAYKK